MPNSAEHGQQFEAVLQAITDAILVVDREGVVCYANAAAERVFGRRTRELVGEPFGLPILSSDTTDIEIVRADGALMTGELRTVDIVWDQRPASVVSLRDITDRKRAADHAQQLLKEQLARAQAEESERQARFLVDAANALAGSLDYSATLKDVARVCTNYYADWCIIDVIETHDELKRLAVAHRNPAQAQLARELCELSPELNPLPCEPEVLRAAEPTLINFDQTSAVDYNALLSRMDARCAMVVPLVSRGKSLGIITFISSESGFSYTPVDLGIAAELGRYAATAVDNCRLYQEAQRGNAAKANFLAVMSHELRTPLNAVIGYTDLLITDVPVPIPEAAKAHAQRIRASARHLLQLIEDVLIFSRLERGHEDIQALPVAVTQLAQDVASVSAPMARDKRLNFIMQLPLADYEITTDASKLEQILLNLLSNAIKFTPAGTVELHVVPIDNWTHFHVKDTGIGIRAEHLQRIFEPFWQAEQARTRRVEGTGLGLSVAHRLAEALGGNLIVQSRYAAGSTFTLQIPNQVPRSREWREGDLKRNRMRRADRVTDVAGT